MKYRMIKLFRVEDMSDAAKQQMKDVKDLIGPVASEYLDWEVRSTAVYYDQVNAWLISNGADDGETVAIELCS